MIRLSNRAHNVLFWEFAENKSMPGKWEPSANELKAIAEAATSNSLRFLSGCGKTTTAEIEAYLASRQGEGTGEGTDDITQLRNEVKQLRGELAAATITLDAVISQWSSGVCGICGEFHGCLDEH